MNPYRDKPGSWLRKGHRDEINEERLTETIEMLVRVADKTNTSIDQVIKVYKAASVNRLTEVLLDSGDAFDRVVDYIKTRLKENQFLDVRVVGDSMCDEIRVKMVEDD